MLKDTIKWGVLQKYMDDSTVISIIGHSQSFIEIETIDEIININETLGDFDACVKYFNTIFREKLRLPLSKNYSSTIIEFDNCNITISIDYSTLRVRFIINKRPIKARPLNQIVTSPPYYEAIKKALRERKNIIITGPAESGKTTLLNAITGELKDNDRCCLIESNAVVVPQGGNFIRYCITTTSKTKRQLLNESIELKPDYVFMDNCQGSELEHVLYQMEKQKGFITTYNYPNAKQLINQIGMLLMTKNMNTEFTTASLMDMLDNIDLIIEMKQASDGSRNINAIYELQNEYTVSLKKM